MGNNYSRSIILTAVLSMFIILSAFPQPKGAKNTIQEPETTPQVSCENELSNLEQFMKINLPDYALESWRIVFAHCPSMSKNIYIIGAKIFSEKIGNAKEPAMKKAYCDTLMMIYDQRMKYFGEEGRILAYKGLDIIEYQRSEGCDFIQKGYEFLKKSIELEKEKSTPAVLTTFISASVNLFLEKRLTNEQVISDYIATLGILDSHLLRAPSSRTHQAREIINSVIRDNKILNCESINAIYSPKFDTNKDNIGFLKLVSGFMKDAQCETEILFSDVSEQLYKLEPSAESAYNLARLFFKRNNYEKAKSYYLESIRGAVNDQDKANYYYELGIIYNGYLKQPQSAAECANEAIRLKSGWGDPYILLGQSYILGKNLIDEGFPQQTVFWIAVDMFQKAKSVDPSVAEKANPLINEYSGYFPSKEDVFFQTLAVGQSYTVGGWINQKTTVRAR